jgi:hypothetical protein
MADDKYFNELPCPFAKDLTDCAGHGVSIHPKNTSTV